MHFSVKNMFIQCWMHVKKGERHFWGKSEISTHYLTINVKRGGRMLIVELCAKTFQQNSIVIQPVNKSGEYGKFMR